MYIVCHDMKDNKWIMLLLLNVLTQDTRIRQPSCCIFEVSFIQHHKYSFIYIEQPGI